MEQKQSLLAFIGSYAEADEPSLYTCSFDPLSGELKLLHERSGIKNPTFLDLDKQGMKLYAIGEKTADDGQRVGTASAWSIHPDNGELILLNEEQTVDKSTCHIQLDRTKRCLIVSSYHGGMIGLSPLLEDGRIAPASDVQQHEGSSVLPVQSQARAHSAIFDRNNRYVVVSDLGLDKLFVYALDLNACKLTLQQELQLAGGSGPRHFVFHPAQPYGYVINELNATITVLDYDEANGRLAVKQTVSTLPDGYDGEKSCADIHISPDGRFLYGSNRGHDSIAVYRIAADGTLQIIEHVSTGGKHPRNFAISPDGRFVLAANRDTDNIVIFARDAETGRLTPTGHSLTVSKPVCVRILDR
ncbi:lactonase family protein [Xylanibacillus composti]|uniref:6-phosphogluconolactonase n=1 Tax=Xylanibacillus composti TaxID=1572762 RepID=A0A8J4H5A3_9BACL|nr:lactonase family protein [Xylanibacillus composti]MDT9726502.1 lactonase family protein [Xylanibacillus composti]GIQ69926.1 hypothetical protein XYCOK13_27500 [Xylanibacillus composti]